MKEDWIGKNQCCAKVQGSEESGVRDDAKQLVINRSISDGRSRHAIVNNASIQFQYQEITKLLIISSSLNPNLLRVEPGGAS